MKLWRLATILLVAFLIFSCSQKKDFANLTMKELSFFVKKNNLHNDFVGLIFSYKKGISLYQIENLKISEVKKKLDNREIIYYLRLKKHYEK